MTPLHAIFLGCFFASVLLGPWWLTVLLAVVLLSFFEGYFPVILGGILVDLLFGAPIPALGNVSALYVLLFALLATCALYLQRKVLE